MGHIMESRNHHDHIMESRSNMERKSWQHGGRKSYGMESPMESPMMCSWKVIWDGKKDFPCKVMGHVYFHAILVLDPWGTSWKTSCIECIISTSGEIFMNPIGVNHDHGKNQDPNGQVTQINSILEFQISSNSR